MAVIHDDRTARGYPLPHPDNYMRDDVSPEDGDVMRLRSAFIKVDADLEEIETMMLIMGD